MSAGTTSLPTSSPSLLRRVLQSDILRIVGVVALFGWYLVRTDSFFSVEDPDVWWHMRSGEWILQHHRLPVTDPFSITGASKTWIAYSWPFGVIIDVIAKQWDLWGIVAYTIAAWIVLIAALLWLLRTVSPNFWTSLLLCALGSWAFERVVSPRPGMFTILFFIVVLRTLIVARRTGNSKLLWLLPPILWLWANVHLQFVYGLALIGAFALESWLNRLFSISEVHTGPPNRLLWATLGASTLVTFLNPYFYGVWWVILDFLHQPKQFRQVLEFHAMAFDMDLHFMVLFLTIAAAMSLGLRKRLEPLWILLLLWAAAMSFHAERDIWVVTVVALVIIGKAASERIHATTSVPPRVWLAAALILLCLVTFRIKTGPSDKDLLAHTATIMPVGAVAFVHDNHLQGPLFNNFDWGGFLIYALPEHKVAIDGRTNVHDQNEIQRSIDTWDGRPTWKDDPLLKDANLVIGAPKFPLCSLLRLDPNFRLVFDDGTSMVFQRIR